MTSVASSLDNTPLVENDVRIKISDFSVGYQGLHTSDAFDTDMSDSAETFGVKYDPDQGR